MKKLLSIALGIMVALGGFIDIGDIVFATQAGAKFGYELLWALAIGVLGIIVYTEMSGRVAAVTKKPVFDIIRTTFSPRLGWFTLVASMVMNVLTCAAEIGGIALTLQLLSDLPYHLLIIISFLGLTLIIWLLKFGAIEKLFGYVGLGLLAFAVAAIRLHPHWGTAATSLAPHLNGSGNVWSYLYFAVGILAATFMPYEVYFYSSGVIEEDWKPDVDMPINRSNAIVGYLLGGGVFALLMMMSAELLRPVGIDPSFLGTPVLGVLATLGKTGVLIALLGILFAIGGAAVETSFSGAYNLSQFFNWKWGKHLDPLKVPRFTVSWLLILILAMGIILSGIDPIALTEYAVIFSVLVMPFTFWPIFKLARDKKAMGKYTNTWFANSLGWFYFVVICIVSLAAIPLMIISNRGQL
jgi:manganese transport protein